MDDAGIIPLFHVKDYVLVHPHVRGFPDITVRPTGCNRDHPADERAITARFECISHYSSHYLEPFSLRDHCDEYPTHSI